MSLSVMEYQRSLRYELSVYSRNAISKNQDRLNSLIQEISDVIGKEKQDKVIDKPIVIFNVVKFLDKSQLAKCCRVARSWNEQSSKTELWARILLHDEEMDISNRILAFHPVLKHTAKSLYKRLSIEHSITKLRQSQDETERALYRSIGLLSINYLPLLCNLIPSDSGSGYPTDF